MKEWLKNHGYYSIRSPCYVMRSNKDYENYKNIHNKIRRNK